MNQVVVAVLENIAATGVLTVAGFVLFRMSRWPRKLIHMIDDWTGEEARPGVPARPGVMERLAITDGRVARIEHEMNFNSGKSIKDAVHRTDYAVGNLYTVLDDHLAESKEIRAELEKIRSTDAHRGLPGPHAGSTEAPAARLP